MFFLFLPLIAALALFCDTKKKLPAFAVAGTALVAAFLRVAAMTFKNRFSGRTFSVSLGHYATFGGQDYHWRFSFTRSEIVLIAFMIFVALLNVLFARFYVVKEKRTRYFASVCALSFLMILTVGSVNLFQFFAGWEGTVLISYLVMLSFHEKQSIRRAANRFFVANMAGDMALLAALFMFETKTGSFVVPPFTNGAEVAFSPLQSFCFATLMLIGVCTKMTLFVSPVLVSEIAELSVPALAYIMPCVSGGAAFYVLYNAWPFFASSREAKILYLLVGSVSAVTGIGGALIKRNIKSVLAYLLTGWFGIVVAVLAVGGRAIALRSFVALMLPAAGLIYSVGLIVWALRGEEETDKMGGLNVAVPYLFWIMAILSLCCVGFPGIGTFGVWQNLYAALYLKGGLLTALVFTVLSFGTAWAFARLLYVVFFAPCKIRPEVMGAMLKPSIWMIAPPAILMTVSLFQEFVFRNSILDDLTTVETTGMLALSLAGCSGICIGFGYYAARKRRAPPGVKKAVTEVVRFLSAGAFYERAVMRPVTVFARIVWSFFSSDPTAERIPVAIRRTAERWRVIQSGKLSVFIMPALIGLFVLLTVVAVFVKG